MKRIGTSVPYSSSRLSIWCERVKTPFSRAFSAMRSPSAALPSYSYSRFWMNCGNSLEVKMPLKRVLALM